MVFVSYMQLVCLNNYAQFIVIFDTRNNNC